MSRLLLVDGHAYAYRSFYAIRGMRSPAGEPTGAVFGFVKALERLREESKGQSLRAKVGAANGASDFGLQTLDLVTVVIWDGGLDGERLAVLPGYKAQRPEMPAELASQIEGMQEFLAAAGLASLQVAGVEADDLIAGLAELAAGAGWDVVIASSDKDFMQLVSEGNGAEAGSQGRTGLLNPGDKSGRVWGMAEVRGKSGVEPGQVVDWLALVGDAVDNIPGVPGVGPKTAAALLERFGSVDGVYARLAEVESERLRGALAAAEAVVRRNVDLVRLKRVVPAGVSLESLRGREPDWGRLAGLFRGWGFRGLLAVAEQRSAGKDRGGPATGVGAEQGVLWQAGVDG
jgi:DNA polymerase-1